MNTGPIAATTQTCSISGSFYQHVWASGSTFGLNKQVDNKLAWQHTICQSSNMSIHKSASKIGEPNMKVIAKIDTGRVLCEVSSEELAFLNGYRNAYENGYDREKASQVGAECNLKRMVTTSQFVRSLRPDVLEKTKKELESIIDGLDVVMGTVGGLEIFSILQDSKHIGDDQS